MFSRKKRIQFIVIIICCMVCSSCGKINPLFSTTSEPVSDWIIRWLEMPTCKIPCWEELTPGVTKMTEGGEHIRNLAWVDSFGGYYTGAIEPIYQFSWQFMNQPGSGSVRSDVNGETISLIILNIGSSGLPLKKVVSSYGYPDKVAFVDCRMAYHKCMIHLVYKNQGMAADLFLDDIGRNENRVSITPESQIGNIYLFSKDDKTYEKSFSPSSIEGKVFDWKGYSKYP
jgi:hypothetical protein